MPVRWEAKYESGDATVDQQHQSLFNYVNKLETQLFAAAIDQELVRSVVQYMVLYAQTHFVYEELCMHRMRCPVAQVNREAHERFVVIAEKFEARLEQEGVTADLVDQLHRVCSDWLVNHICRVDTKMREQLKAA